MHEDHLQEVAVAIVEEALDSLHGKHWSKVQDADQEVGNCWQLASLFVGHIVVVSAEVNSDPHLPHLAVKAHVSDDCIEGQIHLSLQRLRRLVEVVLVGAFCDIGDELFRHVDLLESLEQVPGEGRLQKDLFLHEVVGVLLHKLHYGRIADFGRLRHDLARLLPLVDKHVGVVAVLASSVPIPVVYSGIVELDPSVLALYDRVVVPALRTAHMHHEAFEDIALRADFMVVELLQVDVRGEGHRMVELDLGEGLEIEDQSLQVYE